jgi:hypothetical protein
MTMIAQVSMKLVMALLFSSGWAELVLKKPPPLVPSCLIAIWLATGPPGIDCGPTSAATAPSTGVASLKPWKFCTTPPSESRIATTKDSGSRIRRVVRVRSTQKLPSVRCPRRAMPRMMAITTAMPAAAETKFCTARPSIWVRWLIVSSPLYHCQLVLVMKLTAALNAPSGATSGMFVGLKSNPPCTRSST